MASKTPAIWANLGRINTTDEGNDPRLADQSRSKVVGLADGGFVVAWQDNTSMLTGFEPNDIAGQRFDVLGGRAGGEFLVSVNYQDYDQSGVALAALPDGGFLAAYQSFGDPAFNDGYNIDVSIFDAGGIFERNEDYRQGLSASRIDDTNPSIATFSGGYVLAYETDTAGHKDIVYHIATAPFAFPASPPAQFDADTGAGDQRSPQVAILDETGPVFAIVYTDSATGAIRAFRGDASGQLGTTLTLSQGAYNSQPAVAALKGGGFVAVWADQYVDRGSDSDIFLRIVNKNGVVLGSGPTIVNTTKPGYQSFPRVTALADGGFAVTWRDQGGARIQVFSANGTMVGDEFAVAAPSGSVVESTDISELADGRLMVTYTVSDILTRNRDVHGVILDARLGPVTGTDNGETLTSPMVGGIVYGLGGADTIFGRNGDDRLYGGAGDDVLHGGSGTDRLYGGDDGDRLYGAAGDDWLYGDAGVDYLYGGAGSDRLRGGDGIDYLYGGADNDVLFGDADGDRMYGGDGLDRLYGGEGDDFLYGGEGDDHLYGDGGEDRLYGGDGADVVYGGADTDRAYGGADADYLYGGEGDDFLYGDGGDDRLYGGDGVDRLHGGDGVDRLFGGAGADRLYGGADDDWLYGGDDTDHLYGDAGADRLYGDAGSDYLYGGEGADWLFGGAGNDRFYGGAGNDLIYGGDGIDRAFFSGVLSDYTITAGVGGATIVAHLGGAGADGIDTLYSVEHLVFADQTVTL